MTTTITYDVPLSIQKGEVDGLEAQLHDARESLTDTIRQARADGVPMTHIASVIGVSRQACYKMISREASD